MNNASIHIHPRRVWRNRPPRLDAIRCFNPHTHAGCDFGDVLWHTMYSSFNPHTHAGCDCIYNCACGYGYVSIHTPTQGVTELVKRIPSVKQFQSTHPRRVWLVHLVLEIPPYMFQSTHPRRVWPSARSFLIFIPGFNPHTHAGCDSCILSYWTNNWCFNPHTHAGCDIVLVACLLSGIRFNPHTHAGCDLWLKPVLLWLMLFQSTHPRRVWLYWRLV